MTNSIEIYQSAGGKLGRGLVCAKFARTTEDGAGNNCMLVTEKDHYAKNAYCSLCIGGRP